MQNARKRGGCALITLQTPSQLKSIYRDADAQTILNGCQTQAIFRVSDTDGSEWASRSIGHAETEELRESTRLSSHGRRGHEIHLSVDKRVGPVVMPAEIAMTPDCRCYVKLPGDRPVALTTVKPRSARSGPASIPGFVARRDDGGTAGAVLTLASTAKSKPNVPKTPPEPKTNGKGSTIDERQSDKKEKSRQEHRDDQNLDMFKDHCAKGKPGTPLDKKKPLDGAVWD
jgi:hypothetical protein